MKKLLTCTLLVCFVLFSTMAQAAEAKKKDRPDTDIEKAMGDMAGAFRKLRRQVGDPAQNATSLELVAKIRTGAQEARRHTPLRAADVSENERTAFVTNFQKKMDEFLAVVDQLATALQANKNDDAKKLCDQLNQLQRTDHHDFRRPEKPGSS